MSGLKDARAQGKRASTLLMAVVLIFALDACSREPETASLTKKIPNVPEGSIVVDGKRDDWYGIKALLLLGKDDSGLNVVTAAWTGDDLYLSLDANPMSHIYVYMDSDGDESTGVNKLDVWECVWGKQDELVGHGKRRVKFGHGWDRLIEITPDLNLAYSGRVSVSYQVKKIQKIILDRFKYERPAGKPRNNKDDPSSLTILGNQWEMKIPLKNLGIKPPGDVVFLFVEGSPDTYYHTNCHLVKATIPVGQEPVSPRISARLKREKAEADRAKGEMRAASKEADAIRAGQHARESYAEAQKKLKAGDEEYERENYIAAARHYQEAADFYRKSVEEEKHAREKYLQSHLSEVQESIGTAENKIREIKNSLQGPAFLDKIVLKSWKEIECEILSETDESVRVRTEMGTVDILKSQIKSVIRDTQKEKEHVLSLQSEIEKIQTETNELRSVIAQYQSLSTMELLLGTGNFDSQIAEVEESIVSLDNELSEVRSMLKGPEFPDKIVLKSGTRMECEILFETEESVRVRTEMGTVDISKSQIKSITRATQEEKEGILSLPTEIDEIQRQANELRSLLDGLQLISHETQEGQD